jgi:hypothetical protein
MALTNCPECKKEISDACETCPNCGYPLAATKAVEQAVASAAKTGKTMNKGCLGCLGLLVVLSIIAAIVGPSGSTGSNGSDSYQAGHKIGFIDGNIAMQQGRLEESDSEKEAAAWSIASRFTAESQEKKQDWVRGYKDGWGDGYRRH